MQATYENFIKALKINGPYIHRNCSLCDAPLVMQYWNKGIAFNPNCYCVTKVDPLEMIDEAGFEFYLIPDHGHVEKIEAFISKSTKEVQ